MPLTVMPASEYSLICASASFDVTFHLIIDNIKLMMDNIKFSLTNSQNYLLPGLLREVVDLELLLVLLEDAALLHRP